MIAAAGQRADKAMMLMRAQPTNTTMNILHANQASRVSTVKTCRMRVMTDILDNARVRISSNWPASNAWNFEES